MPARTYTHERGRIDRRDGTHSFLEQGNLMKRRSFLRGSLALAAAPTAFTLPGLRSSRDALEAVSGRRASVIRLSANENPLGISDAAKAAIREAVVDANRYPTLNAKLIQAIAAKHGVPAAHVITGAGSTDVLRMVAQAIGSQPGARVVVPEPTFEHVESYVRPFLRDIARVPLATNHALDIDAMRAAGNGARGEVMIFVCNPNNPTGTITPADDVEAWIRRSTEKFFFVIDEAYFDYVDDASYRTMIPLTARPNVLVTRTFSKVYGLAGLRLGYGIALPETIGRLGRLRLFNSANHLALVAAIASIDDSAFVERSVDTNRQARKLALRTLADLELDALPSHTNFIMHRIRGDLDQYRARMLEAGIRVGRPFPPMLDHNRVSIGLPSEMERWVETLRAFRAKGWS